ncbi:MAG TPA: MHYT domain-containing protein [Stellaceae bacterium]|jgi:signal transduction histidine kinase|nr:MHYT domain-containing protein [Stellaceae bacterium]
MLRVYGCIADQHDVRLVALAGLVCLFACYTALSLISRARENDARRSLAWVTAAAIVFGGGVWATHFVAMLAFRPGFPVGYHVGLTLMSIAVAMLIAWLGFSLGIRMRSGALGGAVLGIAIGLMHYTGMKALTGPADLHWDRDLVSVSLIVGIAAAAAALTVAWRDPSLPRRIIGTLILTVAICGLHFTAMAGAELEPNPLIAVSDQVLAPEWLAGAIAGVMALIIALGLLGSVVDQHLAGRANAEAERLRHHVAELEATKRMLEATSADLRTALDVAATASQAKSQFLATMSHELRTPLNAIIGFSEMLAAETFGPLGDPHYPDYAHSIHASGRHLLQLINDILDFTKLDAGRLELNDEEIDLQELVAGALRMIEVEASRAGIALAIALGDELPLLRADARRVRQVLLNVLSNAVKFTPRGGEVRLTTTRRGGELGIVIADTGIGIAAADIPRALERFGQVDSSLGRKYEGTGLGLPLARRLMELHGGRLDLESEVGIGTTVIASFPGERLIAARRAA